MTAPGPLQARPQGAEHRIGVVDTRGAAEVGQTRAERVIDGIVRFVVHCWCSNASRSVRRAACRWNFTAPSLSPIAPATSPTLKSST